MNLVVFDPALCWIKMTSIINELFEQMLDPQNVLNKIFILAKTVSKFPNLVYESDIQVIDSECSNERFWGRFSKITNSDGNKKYPHLVDFANAMMILFMSNMALIFANEHYKNWRLKII